MAATGASAPRRPPTSSSRRRRGRTVRRRPISPGISIDDQHATVASLTGFASPSATSSITARTASRGGHVRQHQHRRRRADSRDVRRRQDGDGRSAGDRQLQQPAGSREARLQRYGESAAAGIANVGVAGTGGRGTLIGNSLEQSNVDMAQEFTQMILAQRGYQANSKGIIDRRRAAPGDDQSQAVTVTKVRQTAK